MKRTSMNVELVKHSFHLGIQKPVNYTGSVLKGNRPQTIISCWTSTQIEWITLTLFLKRIAATNIVMERLL